MENSPETGVVSARTDLSPADLLALLPYGDQFRFIDEILEVDRLHVVGRYRFREDQLFYSAHFVDRPVTPGVIVLEAMAQCGIVAQGLYLLAADGVSNDVNKYRFLLTGCEAEWFQQVHPGSVVTIKSEVLAWRRRRIRVRAKMFNDAGSLLAETLLLGMGVSWTQDR